MLTMLSTSSEQQSYKDKDKDKEMKRLLTTLTVTPKNRLTVTDWVALVAAPVAD